MSLDGNSENKIIDLSIIISNCAYGCVESDVFRMENISIAVFGCMTAFNAADKY
jgi:hypothetical protein